MNKTIYLDAVTSTAIKSLTDFLKANDDLVEIDGWSKMKAPQKRTTFMEALAHPEGTELRKKFVDHYAEQTGTEQDWTEWEVGDIPADEPAPEPVAETVAEPAAETVEDAEIVDAEPAPEPKTSTAVGHTITTPQGTFVEGGFDMMKSDVAGLDANNSRTALLAAEENLEFEHLRIGVLLHHITDSQHYLTLGYDNMRAFLSAETNLDYRKGMQLIRNAKIVSDLAIPAAALKGVSWAALRHVLPVLSADNYKVWLDAAANMKHVALIDAVNEEKVKQAGALPPAETTTSNAPKHETKPKTFQLEPGSMELVNQAVDKAKAEANVETTGKALEVMAAAYTGSPMSPSAVKPDVPDTTDAGLMNLLTKLNADEGIDGLVRLLGAVGEVWPGPEISVDLHPSGVAAE